LIYAVFGHLMYGYAARLYTGLYNAFIKKPKPNLRFFHKTGRNRPLTRFWEP